MPVGETVVWDGRFTTDLAYQKTVSSMFRLANPIRYSTHTLLLLLSANEAFDRQAARHNALRSTRKLIVKETDLALDSFRRVMNELRVWPIQYDTAHTLLQLSANEAFDRQAARHNALRSTRKLIVKETDLALDSFRRVVSISFDRVRQREIADLVR